MGIDAYSAKEFWLKYGHDEILPRENLFRFFFFLKHTPPHRCAHLLSGATGCSEEAWWASVHRVRSYLNGVVAEIRWAERLSEWNHASHFPYFVTHYVDSMPIASMEGILCYVLFNPKYAGCVHKVTVTIDSLGNIVWICPLAPGTSEDVLILDRVGPKRSKGHYMDYEIGSMDGAYKVRLHVAWPFIGQKTLTKRQKEYNDVHGFCRARIERLFARMWQWGIVRNIWRGSGTELHEYVRVLLHLQQFLIRRQVRYPPYGPWEHAPAHAWTAPTQEDNDDEGVVGDDGDVYALCCTKSDPEKMSMYDKCELQYCTDCIDTHTCDNVTFL